VGGDDRRAFDLRVPRQRADLDELALLGDAVETFDAVDVDQQRRLRQPHIERGDQTLPAGEQPRVVLVLGKQRDRFLERARLLIGKRRRLQRSVLPGRLFLIVTENASRSMRLPTRRGAGPRV
jgi:hypothetical protein